MCGARGEYERAEDRGNATIMLQKTTLRKLENFAKGAKILLLSQKYSKTNQPSYKKSYDFAKCLHCLVLWKL